MHKNIANEIVYKLHDPFSQFDEIKEIWSRLLDKCPHNYFQSWGWIEIWIKSLPPGCNLSLVTGFSNDSPVIAFFIGDSTITRHRLFKFRLLSLNQTHDPYYDSVYIEYNTILIDPDILIPLELLLERIPLQTWDEFDITDFVSIHNHNIIISNNRRRKYDISTKRLESYYVNLDKVRTSNGEYLSLLSQNRRHQINRSIKEYEKMGEIKIQIAENREEALKIFNELIELHQEEWTKRGKQGYFSNEYYYNFHTTLISQRFSSREIQLVRVSAQGYTIGCLYNLIYRDYLFAYINGFNYLPGNVYRPGLVCHYYAILHNAKIGLRCYDFMEGNDPYKKSLSTDHNDTNHIIVRKKNLKYNISIIISKSHRIISKVYRVLGRLA